MNIINNKCIICSKIIEPSFTYCESCMKSEIARLNQYYNCYNSSLSTVAFSDNIKKNIKKTINKIPLIKKKTSNIHKYKSKLHTNSNITKVKHIKKKYCKKEHPNCKNKSNIELDTIPIKRTFSSYNPLVDSTTKTNITESPENSKTTNNLPHSLYRTFVPGLLYSPSIGSYVKVVPTLLSNSTSNTNTSTTNLTSNSASSNTSENSNSNITNNDSSKLQFSREIFNRIIMHGKEGTKANDNIQNIINNDNNDGLSNLSGLGSLSGLCGFSGLGSFGGFSNLSGLFGSGCNDMYYNGALDISNNSKNTDDINNEKIDDSSYPYKWLGENINSIDDLINLGKSYNADEKFRYSLDMKKLNKLVEPLTELQKMIGLKEIKHKMFEMVMYYLQNLDHKNYDMLHSIITGPPGVGKTQLINIIAKIYNRLGFLKSDNVIFAKREDFVAGYVGQTAIKTKKLLEKSIGGVLVLDEAYALGDSSMDGKDTFGREAINTITPFLSEHTHDFAMILAGYKDDIEKLLMTQNPGLERRFPDINRFNISGYNTKELQEIFKNTIETQGWNLDVPLEQFYDLFDKNFKYFNYFGGDMLSLFTVCKKVHSRRIVSISDETLLNNSKKWININDIEEAIKYYLEGAKLRDKNKDNSDDIFMQYMYN